jgi:FG-GAP-like repeat
MPTQAIGRFLSPKSLPPLTLVGGRRSVQAVKVGILVVLSTVVVAVPGAVGSTSIPVWGAPVLAGTLSHGEASEIRTVDLNGDGLRDVIVGPLVWERFDPRAPIFLINKGGGRLVDETSAMFDGLPPSVEYDRELVVADFNGDHRPDVFIADPGLDNQSVNPGYPGQQDRLILSTPDGKWADATANLPQQWSFTHSAAAADVNGGGRDAQLAALVIAIATINAFNRIDATTRQITGDWTRQFVEQNQHVQQAA